LCVAFCFEVNEHFAKEVMLFYIKIAATVAAVILMTIALCSADIQEVRTQFLQNKFLSTSYATKKPISKLHCVQWCSRDRQMGKCKIAGYNKYAKECKLSMDNTQDLMDVSDEVSGVFVIEPLDQGSTIYIVKLKKCAVVKQYCFTLIYIFLGMHSISAQIFNCIIANNYTRLDKGHTMISETKNKNYFFK